MPILIATSQPHLLAGFHADRPDPSIPEIVHLGEQWASRRLFIPRHTHPVWEFYLQISGVSRWEAQGHTYTLMPGGFFAAPPGLPHQMHDRPQGKHHFFFAALDLAPVLARLPALAPGWDPPSVRFQEEGGALLPPFRQLVREVSLALPHRTAGLRLALDALVLEASRLCVPAAGPTPAAPLAGRHPAVRRAKELLDHQPGQAWRLADLSQMAGVSAHHLVECFTREVGVSPRRYLLGVRIRSAQEMLAGSDLPITEVALELGFSSSQHFAATFKRLTGESAQEYRGRHQQRLRHIGGQTDGGAVFGKQVGGDLLHEVAVGDGQNGDVI